MRMLRAQLWELWRTNVFAILATPLGLFACTAIFVAIAASGERSHDNTVLPFATGTYVMICTVASALSQFSKFTLEPSESGFTYRLGYTRPISTFQLVLVPILFFLAMALLFYVVPAIVFSLAMRTSIPLWGPSLVVMCASSILLAAAWIPATNVGRAVALMVCLVSFVVAAVSFHYRVEHAVPFLIRVGTAEYFQFSGRDYGLLIGVPIVAVGLTIAAVDRHRHGEVAAWSRFFKPPTWRRTPRQQAFFGGEFPSPFAAQMWFEIRRFRTRALATLIIFPVVVFAFSMYAAWWTSDWTKVARFWLVSIPLCPLVCQIACADAAIGLSNVGGSWRQSSFILTRPMRTDQMISIKVGVVVLGSLLGMLWMLFVASVSMALAGDWNGWAAALERVFQYVDAMTWATRFAIVLAMLVFYVGSTLLLLSLGLLMPLHPGKFVIAYVVAVSAVVFMMRDQHFGWAWAPLWAAWAWAFSVGIVVATFFLWYKALRADFISVKLLVASACVWILFVAVMTTADLPMPFPFTPPTPLIALGVASLCIPLASAALAPLALSAHRHQ